MLEAPSRSVLSQNLWQKDWRGKSDPQDQTITLHLTHHGLSGVGLDDMV